MKNKLYAIFTVIVGNYDTVKQPIVIDDRFDYIIFTDTHITNPGIWQVRQVTYESKKQWLKARYPRLNTGLCLSEYEASLYIEAKIQFPNDPNTTIDKPKALQELLELSKIISKGIAHVRTDFYLIDEKIYFLEMTFYHGAGYEQFVPSELGEYLGDYIQLPDNQHFVQGA